MTRTEFSTLSLAVVISFFLQAAGHGPVLGGIDCPCESRVTASAGVAFACPQGDGDALNSMVGPNPDLTITVEVRNCLGPVPNIPASDIWLIGCNDALLLCGPGIGATGPTDANGRTTIAGDIAGGGCDPGVSVVVQGAIVAGGACSPCLPLRVVSPDQKNTQGGPPDGVVSAADFANFGTSYQSPPGPYNACHDFVGGPYGTVTISDFAKFGAHYAHGC